MYAWTAVVRGAVIRGLEGSMVVSRRSRWHYGTSYATVFDEDRHPVSDRYWSPLWERWMVSDRMQWHIAKVIVARVLTSEFGGVLTNRLHRANKCPSAKPS